MKKSVHRAALVLALALSATPALAVVVCEDCYPGMPPGTRCFGVCQGQLIRYCSDWLNMGCPTLLSPAEPKSREEAEAVFIQSLRQAPAEVPTSG